MRSLRAACAWLSLAITLDACDAHSVPGPGPVETTPPSLAVVVSDPVAPASAMRAMGSSQAVASESFAYVSLASGSVDSGVVAVIRNTKWNTESVAYMSAGGFDPLLVPGEAGDTLKLDVRDITGATLITTTTTIPIKRRPVVIRTNPPPRKRDVPLNATIILVFSEPMAPQTLTATSVRLMLGAQSVTGQIVLGSDGTHAEFVPDQSLDAAADYVVAVTSAVTDLSGDPLEEASVDFTTSEVTALGLSQIAFTACTDTSDSGGVENCGIHVVNADGTGLSSRSSSLSRRDYDSSPAWSPDGRKIVFSSWRHCVAEGRTPVGSGGDCDREIFVMNADGSEIKKLTSLDASHSLSASFAAWSPDGTRIAFTGTRVGASGLFMMSPDGSDVQEILSSTTLTHGRPSWSPDGSRLVFSMSNSLTGYMGLHISNADGSNVVRLTQLNDAFASWSPDGTRIAFQRKVASGNWHHIHVIDTNGQNEIQLTQGVGPADIHLTPTWSPDGTRIAFIHSSDPRQIRLVRPDGSGLSVLMPPEWVLASLPAWSPVGTVPP